MALTREALVMNGHRAAALRLRAKWRLEIADLLSDALMADRMRGEAASFLSEAEALEAQKPGGEDDAGRH